MLWTEVTTTRTVMIHFLYTYLVMIYHSSMVNVCQKSISVHCQRYNLSEVQCVTDAQEIFRSLNI